MDLLHCYADLSKAIQQSVGAVGRSREQSDELHSAMPLVELDAGSFVREVVELVCREWGLEVGLGGEGGGEEEAAVVSERKSVENGASFEGVMGQLPLLAIEDGGECGVG